MAPAKALVVPRLTSQNSRQKRPPSTSWPPAWGLFKESMTTRYIYCAELEQAGRRIGVVLLVIAVTHMYRDAQESRRGSAAQQFSEIRDLYGSLLIPQGSEQTAARSATRRRESHR